TGCASGRSGFERHWNEETKLITDDKLKKKFGDIGGSVKARWLAKCPETTMTSATTTTPTSALATTDTQDTVKENLNGKTVTVQSRTFKIERVVKVTKSDEGKPVDTVEVELSVAPATGDKVKRADVQTEIVKAANAAVANKLADTSNPIKVARITNQ